MNVKKNNQCSGLKPISYLKIDETLTKERGGEGGEDMGQGKRQRQRKRQIERGP